MSKLISRKAIVPVWLVVVLGVFALFGSPLTFSMGMLLVLVGIVAPAIVLVFTREQPLSVAEIMRQTKPSRTRG